MNEIERLDTIIALMFPGRYRSVGYEFSTDYDGKMHPAYRCYVEGFPYGHGETVEAAIMNMTRDGEGPK